MLYGLFIGINYIGTPNRLNGCVNDARRWYNLFKGQRTLLLEQQCTRNNVLSEITRIVNAATVNDEIIITLSSHGTDVDDKSSENDTAFVPYDLKLIVDDEFAELFSLTKAHICFITDCCNSGTMSREMDQPRYWPRSELPPQITRPVSKYTNPHVLHISGCKDDESSMDQKFGSTYYGNLTYHAAAKYKPGITYKQWYDSFMPLKKQTPQISGPVNRLVVGSEIQEQDAEFPTIYYKKDNILYEPTGWRPTSS